MSEAALESRREGAIVTLALNRPASKNALDAELVDALGTALETARDDASARVIVLTGNGGAFCYGVDLRSAAADMGDPARLEARIDGFHRLIRATAAAPKPVLASIGGPAVGFGADLALACDLRLMSDTAYIDEKFAAIGLMPDGAGTFNLPRLSGTARALEHMLLGTRITAARALELGVANRVVPAAQLADETRAVAQALAAGPPLSFAAIKRAVREGLGSNLEAALGREREGQLALLRSEDAREGIRAFLEKRSPSFSGR